MQWELEIVKLLNKGQNVYIDKISYWISNVTFLAFFWALICAFIFVFNKQSGIFTFFALALVFVIHFFFSEGVLKRGGKIFALNRKRPYLAHPGKIRPIGKCFSDSSFPSSHMATAVGASVVIINFAPSLTAILVALCLAMGFSRMRNGMHYPTDIIFGAMLGYAYGDVSLLLLNILSK